MCRTLFCNQKVAYRIKKANKITFQIRLVHIYFVNFLFFRRGKKTRNTSGKCRELNQPGVRLLPRKVQAPGEHEQCCRISGHKEARNEQKRINPRMSHPGDRALDVVVEIRTKHPHRERKSTGVVCHGLEKLRCTDHANYKL